MALWICTNHALSAVSGAPFSRSRRMTIESW